MFDRFRKSASRHLLVALLLAVAAGCASKDYDPTRDWSKEKLYQEARRAMDSGEFQTAIDYFESLEARYPFGPLALQAQLEMAYAYYRYDEDESAIAACDRFIKLHPTHEGVAYAYYMRGLVRYNQGRSFLNNVFPRDMAQMDQKRLRKAFADFRTVVEQHPNSRYAPDARQRMVYLRNQMARHELDVARFYFRRSAYTAVINRIEYLVSHYDGAPVMPDALALQVKAYQKLGMTGMANDTRRVLAANWPDNSAVAGSSTVAPERAARADTRPPDLQADAESPH